MYSPRRSYGSPTPETSNNPFIDHSSNASARYPDISVVGSQPDNSGPYTSWLQPSGSGAAYPQGSQDTGFGYPGGQGAGGYQPQQQQLQPGWNPNPTPGVYQQQASGLISPPVQAQPTGRPFQPSSSFGQQLQGAVNGGYTMPQSPQYAGYGAPSGPQYAGGYPQQPQYTPQHVQQQNAQYLSEFDPFSQLGSMNQASQTQPGSYGQANTVGPYGQSNPGFQQQHPREYIRQHKAEMESWDNYTWKQALQTFEALKEAWFNRKREIEARGKQMGGAGLFGGGYGGAYGGQAQEMARLEHLAKEAEQNADSVAASTFQMQEAFSGYRLSADLASKRRVRESINAALTSLPDWPPQQF
ncbi:hypothetical protein BXZ70DRAFT_131125 [Cristinia sonorae]|uniref:Uncharacterized protein n=1 Tax=Cristinia sonorae TaxID=1940300 RepID=A0A8K0UNU9_9AGAR|nr:hypothetical protein BXZ70DRAFT_131125 [Cristinia sonorae]